MSSRLPDYADPFRLCEQGRVFEGSIALKEFERLTPLLASQDGEAAFTLGFDRDSEHGDVVSGTVQAELTLTCQRCLMPMLLRVDSGFRLGVVRGPDEERRLPDELDPLLLEEEKLAPRDLIEDELLLSIPPSPMHPAAECAVDLGRINAVNGPAGEGVRPENPFAILRKSPDDEDTSS